MRVKPSLLILAALAACGVRAPDQSAGAAQVVTPPQQPPVAVQPPSAQTSCDVKAGDSAYAVCWATRPDRAGEPPRRVFEVVRRADTLCIITVPGRPVLDGTRRTKVLFTAVIENIESDSIGCR